MTNPAITVDSVSKNFRLYHERNRYIKAAMLRGRRARFEEFWALNLLAFTGFYLGWYFLLRRYVYTNREVLYLSGLWGIYAERI